MKKWSVAVIGLGQIGQGYDYDQSCGADDIVLTHAQAVSSHPAFELIAGIDPSVHARERFEAKFKVPAFETLDHFAIRTDLFIIAVKTALHREVFGAALSRNPVALLCEKPLSLSLSDAEEMVTASLNKDIPLLVNYIRRFDPGVLALKEKLSSGQLGKVTKGRVWYSKGIYNNGSHLVDLLRFLLGEGGETRILQRGRDWDGDPEPDFLMNIGGADIYFLAGKEERFSMVEFELISEKARIQYVDGGNRIEFHSVIRDPQFPSYQILDSQPKTIQSELTRYQWHVLNHLNAHLIDRSKPLYSTGASALATLRLIDQLWR